MERPSSKASNRAAPAAQQEDQQPEEQQEIDLEDAIKMLMGHQKKWEEEGKYVEAEMAKNRVKELK